MHRVAHFVYNVSIKSATSGSLCLTQLQSVKVILYLKHLGLANPIIPKKILTLWCWIRAPI